MISGSIAKRDLQLKASYASLLPYTSSAVFANTSKGSSLCSEVQMETWGGYD